MERKLAHFGIPVPFVPEGAVYVEGMDFWMVDPSTTSNNIELLHFGPKTSFSKEVQSIAHIAYVVESLEEAMAGKKVYDAPIDCGDYTIAFVEEEGIPIEYIEYKK
ncbi:MAG: hypothetical protein R3Y38_00160 [Rikenellaceae bacterium]